jgi:glycosyltransferase involved in cell wall biosynthesis
MILFLNFAPLAFYGGAERWMDELAAAMSSREPVRIMSVDRSIADIYGRIVLGRRFDSRTTFAENTDTLTRTSLTLWHFLPFSPAWFRARKAFREARLVYLKFEIQELAIAWWFGGPGVFKRTIAGLHSPFLYADPRTFLDRLHKLVYESRVCRVVLSRMAKIHVLNRRDERFLKEDFGLDRVYLVPNGIELAGKTFSSRRDDGPLRVLFVGELTRRKGLDILIRVIENAPSRFLFSLAGDGPFKGEVLELTARKKNSAYLGYLERKGLEAAYHDHDVFLFPSRAEGMGLVILEAIYYGLTVVDSRHVALDLPDYAERVSPGDDARSYLRILTDLENRMEEVRANRKKIHEFCARTFAQEKVRVQLINTLFSDEG